ncbi:NAC2-like protein, partial [Mya arenaria]
FQSVVDKLLKKANVSLVIGTSSWREQFVEAITVSPGEEDEDEDKLPSCSDYVMHFLTLFWKVVLLGWLAVFLCVNRHDRVVDGLYRRPGIKLRIKVAAVNDKYADSSIGNVTGSNAVNVFLGIGIAWTIAAVYHAAIGEKFEVDPGTLAFSVTLFCIEGVVAMAILMFRRKKSIGGELGGPKNSKIATSVIFLFFWIFYILMSAMVAYCYVPGVDSKYQAFFIHVLMYPVPFSPYTNVSCV